MLVSLPFFYEFSSFIIRVVRCTDHEVGRMDTISSFTIWWNLKTNDGWVCSCYQRHQRGYKTTSAKKPHNLLRYRHVSLPSYKSINEAQIEFHPHLSAWVMRDHAIIMFSCMLAMYNFLVSYIHLQGIPVQLICKTRIF